MSPYRFAGAKRNSRREAEKLFDGGGLYLLVNPNGSKWWRWMYLCGLFLPSHTAMAPSLSAPNERPELGDHQRSQIHEPEEEKSEPATGHIHSWQIERGISDRRHQHGASYQCT